MLQKCCSDRDIVDVDELYTYVRCVTLTRMLTKIQMFELTLQIYYFFYSVFILVDLLLFLNTSLLMPCTFISLCSIEFKVHCVSEFEVMLYVIHHITLFCYRQEQTHYQS